MNYQCTHCRRIVPLKPHNVPFTCACGSRFTSLDEMRATTQQLTRRRGPAAAKGLSKEDRLVRQLPEIKAAAESREMLIGDAIAAMTKAIGIPPCGGCEKRRVWLNKAHAWVKGWLAKTPDSPVAP
jgi:hypothetical protein